MKALRIAALTAAPLLACAAHAQGTASSVASPRGRDTVAASAAPKALAVAPAVVSGLLHVLLSGGDSALRASYRIRRAEVKVVADLGRKAQAVIMVDGAKALSLSGSTVPAVSQSSRMLQDAFIAVPLRRVTVEAGQQRLPLGYEGSMSSSGLETIERSLMQSDRSRSATLGDVRDAGLMVRGAWHALDYRAGVFNGSGEAMNETDRNVGKAVAGRIVWRVNGVAGTTLGASAVTSGTATQDKPSRDRVGADLRIVRGAYLLQGEAMSARDGATTRAGMYALAGWSPRAPLRVVARFDAYDPDTGAETSPATVTERDYLVGATWMPTGTRLKLQLAVVRKTYTNAITPSATQALSQLQASW